MPVYYGYQNAIYGTQSTIGGSPHNYAYAPPTGQAWVYTGDPVSFHVRENNGATNFNGDPTNEQVSAQEQIGGTWEQVTLVDGVYQQVIWDYTFEITDGTNTYRVGVIDVDLNNDDDLNDTINGDAEDGYYLVFPDGMPTAGVNYTVVGIVENDNSTPHSGLGSTTVCFAAGTRIKTASGDRAVEDLRVGDLLRTKGHGLQPLLWKGVTRVRATGENAPVVFRAGALGNTRDLAVSGNHCMLVENHRAEMLFAEHSVLVRAKDLANGDDIVRREGGWIDYYHLLLPAHHLVFSEGVASESFLPGESGMAAMTPRTRAGLEEAMKRYGLCAESYGPAARPVLKSYEVNCLLAA